MYKITTIILVSCFFCSQIKPQNTEVRWLEKININSSTIGLSKFFSNSIIEFSVGIPVILGVTSIFTKNDDMLKKTFAMGAGILLDATLVYGLKSTVKRNRPYVEYPNLITNYETRSDYSFPSGHTSLAFATATSVSLAYPKWYVIAPSFAWASYTGYARMNLGVHYPSDVLAGAILGAGSAYITYRINKWFWAKSNRKILMLEQNYPK